MRTAEDLERRRLSRLEVYRWTAVGGEPGREKPSPHKPPAGASEPSVAQDDLVRFVEWVAAFADGQHADPWADLAHIADQARQILARVEA